MGLSGCFVLWERDSCRATPQRSQGSTQQHWCSCILYQHSKTTPGPHAKQAADNAQRESHTWQASCSPEVCVLPPLTELARGTEPPATHDTLHPCTCPSSWGTWCFTQHAGDHISIHPCPQIASDQPATSPGAQSSPSSSRAGDTSDLAQGLLHPHLYIPLPLPPCYKAGRRYVLSAGAHL